MKKTNEYKVYIWFNAADTCRDPDDICVVKTKYLPSLKEAKKYAKTYIKENFFHENTKLIRIKKDNYRAVDFCSYGKILELTKVSSN